MFKAINGWNKTKIINRIKRQFKGKSERVGGGACGVSCVYRAPGGKKCAIGLFIPDSQYKKVMDKGGGMDSDRLIDEFPKLAKVLPLDKEACSEFQSTHDGLSEGESIEDQKAILIQWVKHNVEAKR